MHPACKSKQVSWLKKDKIAALSSEWGTEAHMVEKKHGRHDGSWLSRLPFERNYWQVRDKGVPSSYHHRTAVSSLVDDCRTIHPPPAN